MQTIMQVLQIGACVTDRGIRKKLCKLQIILEWLHFAVCVGEIN